MSATIVRFYCFGCGKASMSPNICEHCGREFPADKVLKRIPGGYADIPMTISDEADKVEPIKPNLSDGDLREQVEALLGIAHGWKLAAYNCGVYLATEPHNTPDEWQSAQIEAISRIMRERDTLQQLAANATREIVVLRQALNDLLKTPWTTQNEREMRQARVALGLNPHAPKPL